MRRIAALLAGLALAHAAWSAQPIGRLFFTPAERAQLDVARTQKPVPTTPGAPQPQEVRPATQTITYSGIVRRSDGKSTLWLNNRPVDEKDALSGLALTGRVRADGAVTVRSPETGETINLKVGQRAELQTGRVAEGRAADNAHKPDAAAKADPTKAPGAATTDPAPSKAEAAPRAGEQDAADKRLDKRASPAAAKEAAPEPARAAVRIDSK